MFKEKHFSEGEHVMWRETDGTMTNGVVKRISLYPTNSYIAVQWEDSAGETIHRSSDNSLYNVQKKNVVFLERRQRFYYVTDVEFEEYDDSSPSVVRDAHSD